VHGSVIDWFKSVVAPSEIVGRRVLEVGSMDVNGTVRPLFEAHGPREYVGVDFQPGRGVDRVCDANSLVATFGPGSFDVVVSTEMIEHTPDWRLAVFNMKQVLAPEGLLFVTTRSPGFEYHGYPHDHWRYTPQDFVVIFRDMRIRDLASDPFKPGVFIKAVKPLSFVPADLSAVEVGKAPPNPHAAVRGVATGRPKVSRKVRVQKRRRK